MKLDKVMKTAGWCTLCKERVVKQGAKRHLLKCIDKHVAENSGSEQHYLIRIQCARQPTLYWMYIAIPLRSSLVQLDGFLRDTWMECCGHLSSFYIKGESYESIENLGEWSDAQSMNFALGELCVAKDKLTYEYDFGHTSTLNLEVVESVKILDMGIRLLIRNEEPIYSCSICNKRAGTICSECSAVMCARCSRQHSCCGVSEEHRLPLVNSPRTGICGYC